MTFTCRGDCIARRWSFVPSVGCSVNESSDPLLIRLSLPPDRIAEPNLCGAARMGTSTTPGMGTVELVCGAEYSTFYMPDATVAEEPAIVPSAALGARGHAGNKELIRLEAEHIRDAVEVL